MSDVLLPTTSRVDLGEVHPDFPQAVDAWLEKRRSSWRQLVENRLPGLTPPPGLGSMTQLQAVQWLLIMTDPVFFAETMLVERPENQQDSKLWRLFDYQKKSLRYRGDVINKSAAGVGKTRELEVLCLFGLACRRGKIVGVGNQDGTIDEIVRDIRFQRDRNPYLKTLIPENGIKLRPRRLIPARNGNEAIFVPTGDDGEPIRGQHASNMLLGDEVAKWHNPRIFKELFRAIELGCETRLYSVPDGRTDTRFYKLSLKAVYLDRVEAEKPTWARVHWRKPDMPPPFWSEERRQKLIDQYGGEDTSGYRQNVLGEDGDPEAAVFASAHLRTCRASSSDYVVVKVLADPSKGQVTASCQRANPSYVEGSDSSALLEVDVVEQPISEFDLPAFIAPHLRLPPGNYVLGCDPGQSPDPTEILALRIEGPRMIVAARLQLKGVTWHDLGELIGLHLFPLLEPSHGLGLDSTGVGSAIEQQIRRHLGNYSPELTGVIFNKVEPLVDLKSGAQILDVNETPRTVAAKELATQILELKVQCGDLVLPQDPEVTTQFENHTALTTENGRRRFNPKGRQPDHIIDAARCAVIRRHRLETGVVEPPSQESVVSLPRHTPAGAPSSFEVVTQGARVSVLSMARSTRASALPKGFRS